MRAGSATTSRGRAPVFVLGCPRSGTTLLYYMLLSSGNFAVYREESTAFNLLGLRFGDLSVLKNRQKMMKWWLRTKLFTVSGLDSSKIETKVLAECRNPGDFLTIVMGEIARAQGVERWAETTNEHLLFLPDVKKTIPDALVIHVIRDGRDVALSMEKVGWLRSFPWSKNRALVVTGSYWRWIVTKGREYGRQLGADYKEVRFEDLVAKPHATLGELGRFIDHDLDYDRIRRTGLGAVSEPNTSFKVETQESGFNPIGRWKKTFPQEQLVMFESVLGGFLKELGYPLATPDEALSDSLEVEGMRALYPGIFSLKLWLRLNTPLMRFRDLPEAQIDKRLALGM